MDCKVDHDLLTNFLFGNIDTKLRTGVEQHLLGCRTCLENFLSLKRDIDFGKAINDAPSAAKRVSIHDAARSILSDRSRGNFKPVRSTAWRIVIGGCAAAAAAVLIVLFARTPLKPLLNNHTSPPTFTKTLEETIDSGGVNPNHLHTL